jgi:hypothetical protein
MKFYRHTHNEDGSTRPEDADVVHAGPLGDPETWVVHLLDSKEGKTFDQLLAAVEEYRKTFREDPESKESIALGLIYLLEDDLIRVGV